MLKKTSRLVLPAIVAGTMLFAAGCTQLNDQDRALLTQAKTTADKAAADAADAKASAAAAATSAQQAADAAKAAQASAATSAQQAEAANEKASRMFQKSLRK